MNKVSTFLHSKMNNEPILLDLFCGAGGAAMGYHRAGFKRIVGVDNKPQPNYPFEFILADAMTFPLEGFNLIHASPPCKTFTRMKHLRVSQGTKPTAPDLLTPIRRRLVDGATPYIIENVPGAPLLNPLVLCGSMFGLRVRRHRLFESNKVLWQTQPTCHHKQQGRPVGVWNWGRWGHEIPNGGRSATSLGDALDAMGINWNMTRAEVAEAIPPTYTIYIGVAALKIVGRREG